MSVYTADQLEHEADSAGREARYMVRKELDVPDRYPVLREGKPPETWTCPRCGETVGYEEYDFKPCACQRKAYDEAFNAYHAQNLHRAVEGHWSRAKIPPKYQKARLDTFIERPGTEEALRICKEYVKDFEPGERQGLILIGGFGSGKTHLAVGVARALVESLLVQPLFTSTAGLVNGVKSSHFDYTLLEAAKRSEFLIIDDLAQESATEFDRGLVFDLINTRYENERLTLITSNCGDKQLSERLGKAITSRLYEMCTAVNLKATDYRREIATKGA